MFKIELTRPFHQTAKKHQTNDVMCYRLIKRSSFMVSKIILKVKDATQIFLSTSNSFDNSGGYTLTWKRIKILMTSPHFSEILFSKTLEVQKIVDSIDF